MNIYAECVSAFRTFYALFTHNKWHVKRRSFSAFQRNTAPIAAETAKKEIKREKKNSTRAQNSLAQSMVGLYVYMYAFCKWTHAGDTPHISLQTCCRMLSIKSVALGAHAFLECEWDQFDMATGDEEIIFLCIWLRCMYAIEGNRGGLLTQFSSNRMNPSNRHLSQTWAWVMSINGTLAMCCCRGSEGKLISVNGMQKQSRQNTGCANDCYSMTTFGISILPIFSHCTFFCSL